MHAFMVFLVTCCRSPINFKGATVESVDEFLSIFVLAFSGMFFITLLIFAVHQNRLILSNITTNESIRKRWNAL